MKPHAPDSAAEPEHAIATDGLAPPPSGPGVSDRHATSAQLPGAAPVPLARGVPASALLALLTLTVSRQLRGRRLLILSLLYTLPIVLAVVIRRYEDPYRLGEVETLLIFGMIPQALLPLTALLLATGMVQDELEEQTLTYIMIRPIPRWMIYLVKVAATWLTSSVLAAAFTAAAESAVYWNTGALDPLALARRTAIIAALVPLSLLAYTAIFGLVSLLLRRSLLLGVAYILLFEGVLANVDFVVRRATVMYSIRTLSLRWLGLQGDEWSIDLETAPDVFTCLATLILTGVTFALLGSWVFSVKEFRVKTPEGS